MVHRPLDVVSAGEGHPPPGTAPGTLVADPEAARSVVRVVAYGPEGLEERRLVGVGALDDLPQLVASHAVTWVDVCGLADLHVLARVAEVFGLHPLAMEDVTHTVQRPKVEEYGSWLFLVARVRPSDGIETEQFSLFLGSGVVVTFQERADAFESVRRRLHGGRERLRGGGADYLFYALLDAVIDAWFPVVEERGERLEELEEDTFAGREVVPALHEVRHELAEIRRAIRPLHQVVTRLVRGEFETVSPETRIFLRDCQDHAALLLDAADGHREACSSLVDVSLSLSGHKMNEVMKVLTIISTIFIPLTFITGVYGMNFDPVASPWNMPELRAYWGYPLALGVMGAVAVALALFFRRMGWLAGRGPR